MLRRVVVLIVLTVFLISCIPTDEPGSDNPTAVASPDALPTPYVPPLPTAAPVLRAAWVSPAAAAALWDEAESWGLPLVERPEDAGLRLDLTLAPDAGQALWIYALVAPFPTILDGISGDELRQAWAGNQPAAFASQPLLMDASTLGALAAQWGQPASGAVRTVPESDLLAEAWAASPSWAVVPFESLAPEWKVLTVDGQSPLRKDFDPAAYPLTARFALTCADPCPLTPLPSLPVSNRDASKLTTLMMTGVTALVRSTAYVMENKGALYPGRLIRDWMREADIAHVSNEVSFFSKCPFPNPGQTNLIFCSRQEYMDLLLDIGTDVVELTGDHLADYGHAALLESLAFYRENGLPYYGGGANLDEAKLPLLMEHNGNKIAFIGCNAKGDQYYPKASNIIPGPAPCNFVHITDEIQRLQAEGYLVIATFSWHESYGVEPHPLQVQDFRRMADAGAVIVSGSQSHVPQKMEFYNDGFIHYGLGNLFFDQMYYIRLDGVTIETTRLEMLDRHVFYDGRYIGTELLTAMLEDFATPRPMEPGERFDFLQYIFKASGWKTVEAAPTLTPTVTPTLLTIATPESTPTP